MSEESTFASWEDLSEVEATPTNVIKLENLSEKIGKPVNAKIRAIEGTDLLKCANFPMDQINAMVSENASDEEFGKHWTEHIKTMDYGDLMKMVEDVIRAGLIDPDPEKGDIKKFKNDWEALFSGIMELTMPGRAVNSAAAFRPDGE